MYISFTKHFIMLHHIAKYEMKTNLKKIILEIL